MSVEVQQQPVLYCRQSRDEALNARGSRLLRRSGEDEDGGSDRQ